MALENSPQELGYFRASLPVAGNRLQLAAAARYVGRRDTPFDYSVAGFPLADFTATTNHLHRNFDIQLGVRNLLNRRYVDPLSSEHMLQELPAAGRTAFIRLIWRYGE
jgi:outer membrane receptor protein involved in Fe transport